MLCHVLTRGRRDPFDPPPSAVELLLTVAELKLLAREKAVTLIEVEDDELKLPRHGDGITLGGKFPGLTKKTAEARVKEITKLLLAILADDERRRIVTVISMSWALRKVRN